MALEDAKDYLGVIVAAVTAIGAAMWVWIVMLFGTRSEVTRAHTRIDNLDRKVEAGFERLARQLEKQDERLADRDTRLEQKLDLMIREHTQNP